MVWQTPRMALLAGAVASVLALTARADDAPQAAAPAAPAPAAAAPIASAPAGDCCGPQFRTVCVTEWVPETYQCTRTVYKTEQRQETYTAYRCECVPETRTRVCTVNRMVPEVKQVTRNYCVTVPVTEERTSMETFWSTRQVTKMVSKCVDRGHWECREVCVKPSHFEKMKKHFHHKHDCCECACECEAPKTKTERVWVPCKVWEQVPVTCCERVCEQRPVKKLVTTCKTEVRQEVCNVTCYKCVPEQKTETYTVNVMHKVPYQATRCVNVCVPTQETFTATRCVARTVQKQVPVETCCAESSSCGCTTSHKHGHKQGHKHGHKSDCCN